ncbi:Protein of unknown function [Lactobacillus delbrueckii subsp. bulgaricus]|nr:Protein of unknown function [Lactobacillus delbrueckii subsp. bulgaricus]
MQIDISLMCWLC